MFDILLLQGGLKRQCDILSELQRLITQLSALAIRRKEFAKDPARSLQ